MGEEEEDANGFGSFGDIDIVDNTTVQEEREDSSISSVGLSEIDCGYQSNATNSKVDKAEIDGALLNKLGVPLDYNEQNQLAKMIIENRKLEQENAERFDDESPQQHQEEENEANEEEKEETISDGDLSPIGPDDVKCENCGKYVHKMSFMMHEMHCLRQFMRCKLCNDVIKRSE